MKIAFLQTLLKLVKINVVFFIQWFQDDLTKPVICKPYEKMLFEFVFGLKFF